MPSLLWASTSGEQCSHGSDASLDNLANFTYIIILRPDVTGTACGLMTKGIQGDQSRSSLELRQSSVTDGIFFTVDTGGGGGVDMVKESVANGYTPLNWQIIAATYTDSTKVGHIYTGNYATPTRIAEVSYNSNVTGVGAMGDNSSYNQYVGTYGSGTAGFFDGFIALAAIWNRALTLGELRQQQYQPHPTSGCVLFCPYGINPSISSQPDLSGNPANSGVASTVNLRRNGPPIRLFRGSSPRQPFASGVSPKGYLRIIRAP